MVYYFMMEKKKVLESLNICWILVINFVSKIKIEQINFKREQYPGVEGVTHSEEVNQKNLIFFYLNFSFLYVILFAYKNFEDLQK